VWRGNAHGVAGNMASATAALVRSQISEKRIKWIDPSAGAVGADNSAGIAEVQQIEQSAATEQSNRKGAKAKQNQTPDQQLASANL